MAALRHHGARRTYRRSRRKARLVSLIVLGAIMLVGFVQAVAAIKVSMDRAIKVESLKDS